MTKLNINNELSSLKSVVVCWGYNVPDFDKYKTDDQEFLKFHPFRWNKNLLLKQQELFFKCLEKYKVKLIFPKLSDGLIWQMYTRDTAFVIGNKLFHSNIRKLQSRNGEVKNLLETLQLNSKQICSINDEIEGGDVLVESDNTVFVGHSNRTNQKAIDLLNQQVRTHVFELGKNVMHLDTRLTLLPKNIALANLSCFSPFEKNFITNKFHVIDVTDEETKRLGTNVIVINPETICVAKEQQRIAIELSSRKFNVEILNYSEPVNIGGSFRCTTLPLKRTE